MESIPLAHGFLKGSSHTASESAAPLREVLRLLQEAVQQYARHLARTALTALAHVAPEYEPAAVRTALWLVHMGSSLPTEAFQQRR